MPSSASCNCAIASSTGALGLALLLGACGVQARNRPSNVILICMDTVRADHLGCYGYRVHPTTPNLDALADRSILFEDASATAGWTKPSVPSFFTGTFPCQHGVYEGSARLRAGSVTDVLPDDALTLAEVFGGHGYETAAFVKNAQLRPGFGFEQGFDLYVDDAGDAREVRWRARDWLDARSGDRPFFLYLHVLDAHWPYPVPDDYATRFATAEEIARFRGGDSRRLRNAINDGEVELGAEGRVALEALYDGAIRYVDEQIGLLLDYLELRDLGEDTVVCVISDHGEEFGEHGRIGHGHGLWENLLRVPWILHVPGGQGVRIGSSVSLVDLFPTLPAAAGIGGRFDSEGTNRLLEPDVVRPIFAEHKAPDRYTHSLRRGTSKIVRQFVPPHPPSASRPIPARAGERWEAELERTPSGELRATQLKPRQEPPEDPVEIKERVRHLDGASFTLGGFPVRFTPETQRIATEDARGEELFEGLLVKVRGSFENGVFVAERIKLYAADAEPAFEVRGAVEAVEGSARSGRIRIGELWIAVDSETELKDVPERKPRMQRDEILRLLELGAVGAVDEGFLLRQHLFDLTGIESDPVESGPALDALSAELDGRVRRLLERRAFSADDRLTLTDEALRDLKAIGYVR